MKYLRLFVAILVIGGAWYWFTYGFGFNGGRGLHPAFSRWRGTFYTEHVIPWLPVGYGELRFQLAAVATVLAILSIPGVARRAAALIREMAGPDHSGK